jgi:hypothetical protein
MVSPSEIETTLPLIVLAAQAWNERISKNATKIDAFVKSQKLENRTK